MLARGSLARWAAAKTSARDLPQLARFLSTTLCAHRASDLPVARAISRAYVSALNAYRSYATAAATKPTATVKKAVKAQAQSSARPKRAAASKTTSKTAKKPTKKATAKKTKPKPKRKPKAKKKPTPKKKVVRKKVLTPEEKLKAQIRELRKTALRAPTTLSPVSAYNAFVAEGIKKQPTDVDRREALTRIAVQFKELTPAEREHYNHLANERSAAKQAEYTAWINTHTPVQIYKANRARLLLRRKLPKQKKRPAHTEPLKDDRLPRRPPGAYAIFNAERWASGDMKGIGVAAAAKLVAEEWKALSAGEKKKYDDAAAPELAKYRRDMESADASA